MNVVWVCLLTYYYDSSEIDSVWATEEMAEKRLVEFCKQHKNTSGVNMAVENHVVQENYE